MDNLSAFVESLQDLMTTKDIKPTDIHKATKISLNVIYAWFRHDCIPTVDSLSVLSNYFDCSVDYLCGRTEHSIIKAVNPTPFHIRFSFIMNKSGMSFRELSTKTKVSLAGLHGFIKGTRKPLLDNLIRLATFFECSLDYLLGLSDDI
ncbi:MAG: helix-turn-helix domain-containing protein [Firmicutes bacterium]|nr:helix-turn-helix domain-containing protein [Bacillota bacterium]